jgi:hypothetical protein
LPEPLAENDGVVPATGLLLASRSVIVIIEVDEPSATTGLVPVIEELAATTAVAEKLTVVVSEPRFAGSEIERVLVSATVEVIDPTAWPEAFVTLEGSVNTLPEPVDAKWAVTFGTTFP